MHVESMNTWLSDKKAKLFSACGNTGRILGAKLDALGIPETDTECYLFIEKMLAVLPRREHVDKYTKWVLPIIDETRQWYKKLESVKESSEFKVEQLFNDPNSRVRDIIENG